MRTREFWNNVWRNWAVRWFAAGPADLLSKSMFFNQVSKRVRGRKLKLWRMKAEKRIFSLIFRAPSWGKISIIYIIIWNKLNCLKTRVVNLWAGPAEISGRSCSILFLSVFLKDFSMKIWTLLITHLKLSIVHSKKWRILAKSSRNIRKKRPGPARRNFGLERPGPAQLKFRPTGPARPGPAQSTQIFGPERPGPICQTWDLQPCLRLSEKLYFLL